MTIDYEQVFNSQTNKIGHCFSFWKGRIALYAILKALGITQGDEVILPGFTCVVVPSAIEFTDAKPIYIDNKSGTYHIDPELVKASITKKTKAILIQHTFGIPGPLEEISYISQKYGIPFIEDCAHSIGSSVNNRPVGTWGIASFFSSQWSKPYTTGLGGIAVINDTSLVKKMQEVVDSMVTPPFLERFKLRFEYDVFDKFFHHKCIGKHKKYCTCFQDWDSLWVLPATQSCTV